MPVESATEIQELDPTNPVATDPLSQGDDHLRMIKTCLQTSLPGMVAPWETTEQVKAADPTYPTSLVTLQFLQGFAIAMPIGWPFFWLLDALPVVAGSVFLDLNGAAISRSTYADLFALYGVTYGAGNGTTTFNLPDARGEFLRVMDAGSGRDPNAATRTNRGDGVTGDNVGTKELDAVQNATGILGGARQFGASPDGVFDSSGSLSELSVGGGNFQKINFDLSRVARTSTETRGRNLNVRFIVRAS